MKSDVYNMNEYEESSAFYRNQHKRRAVASYSEGCPCCPPCRSVHLSTASTVRGHPGLDPPEPPDLRAECGVCPQNAPPLFSSASIRTSFTVLPISPYALTLQVASSPWRTCAYNPAARTGTERKRMATPQLMQGMQNDLTCQLCLELFRSPVTPECGHTFCQSCLTGAPKGQDSNGSTLCPTCQAPSRPETLHINRQLEHLVQSFRQVPQGHCLEHLDPLSVFCEQDKELICGVCASLGKHKGHNIITAAEAHAKMKRQLPQQQVLLQEARLRKEKTVALLDRQVAEVKDTVSRFKSSVRDQLNSMRSYLDIMENSLFREADKAEINASGALLGERKSLAHYVEQLGQMEGVLKDVEGQEQTEFLRKFCVVTARLGKILSESPLPGRLDIQLPIISDEFKFQVWRKMFRALMPGLENLTFDPDSAQQNLVVSGDGKSVECSDHKQPVSDDPGRFDKGNCLVTKQSFTEGEHYWEVVVEDKPRWALGVISETANRKGKLHASPSNGFWIMGCKEGKVYEAHAEAKEPRLLRVDGRPEKIGVYLSFSDGVVSFFDSGDEDNVKLLYTFHERFSGRLHPFFDVCWHDKGKNSQPLKFYVPPGGQ